MKDKYEDAKNASHKRMMMEVTADKAALIREIKQGLGSQLVEELENVKPLSPRRMFWNKIKKVLGL